MSIEGRLLQNKTRHCILLLLHIIRNFDQKRLSGDGHILRKRVWGFWSKRRSLKDKFFSRNFKWKLMIFCLILIRKIFFFIHLFRSPASHQEEITQFLHNLQFFVTAINIFIKSSKKKYFIFHKVLHKVFWTHYDLKLAQSREWAMANKKNKTSKH